MSSSNELKSTDEKKSAGSFSRWLHGFILAMKQGGDLTVACDKCVACCKSSYFIHVSPDDTAALGHIPPELLFAAPGLPAGHYLMGTIDGHCPMFQHDQCQIYPWRPLTCRQFDCRVLTAVAPAFCPLQRPGVASAANRFAFELETPDDKRQFDAVQRAAAFLMVHRERFLKDTLPGNEEHQALLAIRIHHMFVNDGDAPVDIEARVASIQSLVRQ